MKEIQNNRTTLKWSKYFSGVIFIAFLHFNDICRETLCKEFFSFAKMFFKSFLKKKKIWNKRQKSVTVAVWDLHNSGFWGGRDINYGHWGYASYRSQGLWKSVCGRGTMDPCLGCRVIGYGVWVVKNLTQDWVAGSRIYDLGPIDRTLVLWDVGMR